MLDKVKLSNSGEYRCSSRTESIDAHACIIHVLIKRGFDSFLFSIMEY